VVRVFLAPPLPGQRRNIQAVFLDPSNFKYIGDGHNIAEDSDRPQCCIITLLRQDGSDCHPEELNMAIPEPPPDPTYYRVLLSDPEGSDAIDLQRFLEDNGLKVFRVEELSSNEMALQTKKPSEKAEALRREDRRVG
jgi:hypothetical protein